MPLLELQIVFKRFFETSARIPFLWENQPSKLLQKPYGVLRLGPSRSLGRDQVFYDSVAGERELMLNCQIFSRSNIPPQCARSVLERIRLMLALSEERRSLREAGLIFVESTPIVDLDFTCEGRSESRASFDTVWRQQEVMEIPEPGYFNHVSVKGLL